MHLYDIHNNIPLTQLDTSQPKNLFRVTFTIYIWMAKWRDAYAPTPLLMVNEIMSIESMCDVSKKMSMVWGGTNE